MVGDGGLDESGGDGRVRRTIVVVCDRVVRGGSGHRVCGGIEMCSCRSSWFEVRGVSFSSSSSSSLGTWGMGMVSVRLVVVRRTTSRMIISVSGGGTWCTSSCVTTLAT